MVIPMSFGAFAIFRSRISKMTATRATRAEIVIAYQGASYTCMRELFYILFYDLLLTLMFNIIWRSVDPLVSKGL